MKTIHLTLKAVAVASIAVASGAAFATNGMNMEAYGAKAGGMGGASMAYDNGNSAVMNNPATLVLGKEGSDFGIGFTHLGPDVGVTAPALMGGHHTSGGDSYKMPSMSWIKKSGNVAFGAAMLAQGGMGTEYPTMMSRSEVAFGRLMAPLAYKVNDQLSVAGQLDFVWGSMDMQTGIPQYIDGQGQPVLVTDSQTQGRIDFSNRNDFTGAAVGSGFAGKVGIHYQMNKDISFGATYHSKTDLSNLKGRGTFLTGNANSTPGTLLSGNYDVVDFQWPETWGFGAAWNATSRLMFVADYKRIGWADTMETVQIKFTGDNGTGNATIPFPQNWDDQDVFMIGAQYKVTDAVAVRVGYNYAKNPIPDSTINYLFPAIIESHYTFGIGWQVNPTNSVAFSMTHAPKVTATNPNGFGAGMSATNTHSQTTWRINYNYHF